MKKLIAIHLAKNRQLTSAIKSSKNNQKKLEIADKLDILPQARFIGVTWQV